MEPDAYEELDEALNLLSVTSEKIENEEVHENIEAVIELIEEAQRRMEVADEMNEMMTEHEENLEDFTEM